MKRRKHHSTKALQPLHWAGIGLVNQNPASATIAAFEAAFFLFQEPCNKKASKHVITKNIRKDDETGIMERQRTEGLRR